jgi:predicted CXXCH cytochrome family protein
MGKYDFLPRLLILLACLLAVPQAANAGCLDCHREMQRGFTAAHAAFAENCVQCHAGDAGADTETGAHRGLIAFPGDMESARQVCGDCHGDKVDGVTHSLMHTGKGMVSTTRRVFGEIADRPGHNDLQHLTHSPADSLLRKLCASCHLGQVKTAHRLDATFDRGGGCLACHINDQSSRTHPALTAQVNDARCFGCHSRSSRISLNYAGLAETAATTVDTKQLADGRGVEFRPADRHHAAGMACIDCHTERDLMGTATAPLPSNQKQAVDIRCEDCHRITRTISPTQWPPAYRALLSRIPYPVETGARIPATANGTPLWHIELQGDAAWLHRKLTGDRLRIPPYRDSDHPLAQEHRRLTCTSCHSQWAPQCYGCHLHYDKAGEQYDHADRKMTAGIWKEKRSNITNGLPPLGVNADNRIVPVIPGMIMEITHPDWPEPRFVRRFQATEPHTTGAARGCASCHRSSTALGLGQGHLQRNGKQWTCSPGMEILQDGLSADAWTRIGHTAEPIEPMATRPFTLQEIERILAVTLPTDGQPGETH